MKKFGYIALLLSFTITGEAQFSAVLAKDTFEVLVNDSAILNSGEGLRGSLQWQKSDDSITWTDIDPNGSDHSLSFVPELTESYRLKVTEGTCDPLYSDIVKIYSRYTTVTEYLDDSIPVSDLLGAGVSVTDLLNAGIEVSELLIAGASVSDLIDSGITVPELLVAGVSVADLLEAGISVSELLAAGATVPGFSCDTAVDFGDGWRGEANYRINKYRKSNLTIKVVTDSGEVIPDITVNVTLKRHQFKFGVVVDKYFMTSAYTNIYRENFLKYFNSGGFNNGLKPKQRGNYLESVTDDAMPWFRANNIDMRGHLLVWEGASHMRPEEVEVLEDVSLPDQEKGDSLIALASIHFHHAIEKWEVFCWDVINEPIGNHDINDLVAINTFTYWFKLADSLRNVYDRPDIQLFLNEFQVISAIQDWALSRPQKYRDIIDQIIAEGAPIEGIGFQSRIKNGYLPPQVMYQRLCDFEKYNLPYHCTEFEVRDTDTYTYTDTKKKQIVNELLTIYFSHPNVEGIWHWTFADTPTGTAPWALFKNDGTPYPCGEEWIRVMEEDFNTDVTLFTDETGYSCVRGFKGVYEISVTYLDETITETITLDEDKEVVLTVPSE